MLVADLLKQETQVIPMVRLTDSIEACVQTMRTMACEVVAVIDDDRIIGTLHKERLMRAHLDMGLAWGTMLVHAEKAIEKKFPWAHPEQRLIDCFHLMNLNDLSEILVIEDGLPIGLLRLSHVIKALAKRLRATSYPQAVNMVANF